VGVFGGRFSVSISLSGALYFFSGSLPFTNDLRAAQKVKGWRFHSEKHGIYESQCPSKPWFNLANSTPFSLFVALFGLFAPIAIHMNFDHL
jgi:hypothetical protein